MFTKIHFAVASIPLVLGGSYLYVMVWRNQPPNTKERRAVLQRRLQTRNGVVYPPDDIQLPPDETIERVRALHKQVSG